MAKNKKQRSLLNLPHKVAYFLSALCLITSTFCIGRANPPEQVKLTQAQNEVLGKFARRVGEKELNILLNDPKDAVLPGLPVGDLLYILANVNEDKLIQLVQGISATTTLELILSIKRVGCTRYEAIFPGNGFDARSTASINQCTWQHYHVPNLMVQLLNGTTAQGLQTLIDTVKHSYLDLTCASNTAVSLPTVPVANQLGVNQPLCPASTMITTQPAIAAPTDTFDTQPYKVAVDHYSFLLKLAYIVVGFDTPTSADPNLSGANLVGPTKLFNLMNMTLDGRDMTYLLDSFDSNTVNFSREAPATYCPGVPSTTSNCVYIDTSAVTMAVDPYSNRPVYSGVPVYNTYDASGILWNDICPTLLPSNACDSTVLGSQLQGLRNLLSVMDLVTNTSKMGTLLNGKRTTRYNTTEDSGQIRYFTDRLRPVIEHRAPSACIATSFPGTAAEQAMQYYVTPHGGSGEWNAKLAEIINRVANLDRMMDLIYNIDDGFSITHTLGNACPNRGIDNLMVMLNNINGAVIHDLPNTTNNEVRTAAYLIDNVALFPTDADPRKRNKVKYLVEYIGNPLDVLQIACYDAVTDKNTAGVQTCDDRGLVNLVANGSKLDDASVADLDAGGKKLSNLADQISEIEDMRFLVRKVSMANMTAIVNGVSIAGTANIASLVNKIEGQDCWDEDGGVIASPAFNYGIGYTASVLSPGAAYSGNFVVNPLPGGGGNAIIKAIVETDTVNHPTFVGRVRAFVVTSSGSSYVAGTYNDGGGAQMAYGQGNCRYNPPTSYRGFPTVGWTGATGLGKMVNVINHITGSPGTIVTLINGVTDGAKLGILINGVNRSSNLVGVVNATVDASRSNNATITDLISLMNSLSREDVYKMVYVLDNLGNAREVTAAVTVPSGDHDMVSQLFAAYNAATIQTTSGLGVSTMAELIGSLRMDGGQNYTYNPIAPPSILVSGGGGAGATATIVVTPGDTVGAVTLNTRGSGCATAPTVTFVGGSPTTPATAVAVIDSVAQQTLRIHVTNSGEGYAATPTISFSGGCATQPTATARMRIIGGATITNPGSGYTGVGGAGAIACTCPTCGGTGVQLTCTVSGGVQTLRSYYGGSGYVTGQQCPLIGAGGSTGECTVIETGGQLTGCSVIAPGINYADERIVKIGGRAEAAVDVDVNPPYAITAINVTNPGCGYAAVPTIEVLGCATAPTFNVTIPGGRVNATVATAGSGCPIGAKVVVGENPFVAFADGASAIVDTIASGTLTSVSISEPSINAAQLIGLIDRDATGVTSGTRGFSITYNDTTPNISAREALVRLLHHGVTIPASSIKGYFSEGFGVGSIVDVVSDGLSDGLKSGVPLGGAGVWTNTYAVNLPGLGVSHIAGTILNSLGGVEPTQTLINMVNANSIDLTDTLLLLGCGDHSTYSNSVVSPFSWQRVCQEIGPGIW